MRYYRPFHEILEVSTLSSNKGSGETVQSTGTQDPSLLIYINPLPDPSRHYIYIEREVFHIRHKTLKHGRMVYLGPVVKTTSYERRCDVRNNVASTFI